MFFFFFFLISWSKPCDKVLEVITREAKGSGGEDRRGKEH